MIDVMTEFKARIVVFGNRKGGVGKSTLAVGVAGAWAEQGYRVLLIDADPQASAFRHLTNHPNIHIAQHLDGDIQASIRSVADDYDFIIVDTPAVVNDALLAAIQIATLLVIPTKARGYDTHSAGTTVRSAQAAGCPAVFVLNEISTRTRLTKDAREALHDYKIPVCAQAIAEREAHPQAATMGKTVVDVQLNHNKAANEIRQLAAELIDRMEGHKRGRRRG
jgi:chromosome partitioning protein